MAVFFAIDKLCNMLYNISNKLEQECRTLLRQTSERIIAVYTEDELLFQKILLDAPENFTVERGSECHKKSAYLILVDKDTARVPQCEHLSMSRRDGADIKIPFALGTIKKLVSQENDSFIRISENDRSVFFHGKRIRLTDVELSLLSLLLNGRGEYVSRKDILQSVWNNGADGGVINVYIHYLREKLEKGGEKIILSSRKLGYAIDGRFIDKAGTERR